MCNLNVTNLRFKRVCQVTSTLRVRAPNQNHYYCYLFSKIKTKQDDGNIFWWIFGHVSLLKFEKDAKDDNHYSVLQIDIFSRRKYCDLMSIMSNKYVIQKQRCLQSEKQWKQLIWVPDSFRSLSWSLQGLCQ